MAEIKAVETEYKGCRFRSRLEARWAVFFDAMKWSWRYEPQGYDIGGEWYLPDFWVSHLGWVEVKGSLDASGMARLLDASRHLPAEFDGERTCPSYRAVTAKLIIFADIPDPTKPWAHLQLGTVSDDEVWRFAHLGIPGDFPTTDWNLVMPRLEVIPRLAAWFSGRPSCCSRVAAIAMASTAARSARFEHGQSGAIPPLVNALDDPWGPR